MLLLPLLGSLRSLRRLAPPLLALLPLLALAGLAHYGQGARAFGGLAAVVFFPLLAFAAAGAAAHRIPLRRRVEALVDCGASPARAWLAQWVSFAGLQLLFFVVAGLAFLAIARNGHDAGFVDESRITLPGLAAVALAYASYYTLASAWLGRAWRAIAVGLDLIVGAIPVAGWLLPSAHLGVLLGAHDRTSHSFAFAFSFALAGCWATLSLLRCLRPTPR